MSTDASAERKKARQQYLAKLLAPHGVTLTHLAPGAQAALHEYARFILVSGDAGSADWGAPIIHLCKAVECELIAMLDGIPGLEDLERIGIGQMGRALQAKTSDLRSALSRRGLPATYILDVLPELLLRLAEIRRKSQSAHGSKSPRKATRADHDKALNIAVHQEAVIPTLASHRARARR